MMTAAAITLILGAVAAIAYALEDSTPTHRCVVAGALLARNRRAASGGGRNRF